VIRVGLDLSERQGALHSSAEFVIFITGGAIEGVGLRQLIAHLVIAVPDHQDEIANLHLSADDNRNRGGCGLPLPLVADKRKAKMPFKSKVASNCASIALLIAPVPVARVVQVCGKLSSPPRA